jgi:hypothetical protein
MAYTDILDTIKGLLEQIPGIGRVHGYLRYFKDEPAFDELFMAKIDGIKQLRAWTITRDGIPKNQRYTTSGPHRIGHLFVIRGYLGVLDGVMSEMAMQALVDAVVQKLDNAVSLGALVEASGPATVPVISHTEFGRVLCHYAEINFPVTEQVQRNYV